MDSGEAFQSTVAPLRNQVPDTFSVKDGPPATLKGGLRRTIEGTVPGGAVIVSDEDPIDPNPKLVPTPYRIPLPDGWTWYVPGWIIGEKLFGEYKLGPPKVN